MASQAWAGGSRVAEPSVGLFLSHIPLVMISLLRVGLESVVGWALAVYGAGPSPSSDHLRKKENKGKRKFPHMPINLSG